MFVNLGWNQQKRLTRLWWGNISEPGQLWVLGLQSSSPPEQTDPPLCPWAPLQRTGSRAGAAVGGSGKAPETRRSWRAPGRTRTPPGCGLPAPGPSCAGWPGIRLTLGTLWGTRMWPGGPACWSGLWCPCCSPGCSWGGLSPGWSPQSCFPSPGSYITSVQQLYDTFKVRNWICPSDLHHSAAGLQAEAEVDVRAVGDTSTWWVGQKELQSSYEVFRNWDSNGAGVTLNRHCRRQNDRNDRLSHICNEDPDLQASCGRSMCQSQAEAGKEQPTTTANIW